MSEHNRFMERALALARQAEGDTSPNPCVGAVVVRDGRIVAEGIHRRAGAPHAEAEALQTAGDLARGATLYVTLEPCNHEGKTPPCTEAILQAGIGKVVYAVRDPNPGVTGRGHERLAEAGIDVDSGLCSEEARHLNRFYFYHVRTGRPYVVAKFAASLDGKIATVTGRSRWITGTAALTRVHELRRRVDAVLIGAGTVIADDPGLSVRLPGFSGRQPLRLVLDSRGRVSPGARLFESDLPGSAIVATTRKMPSSHRKALEARGVECLILPSDGFDRVDLPALLTELGRRKISSLLIEGGGEVLGSAFDAGIVHELWAFVSPLIIGGLKAPTPVQGRGFPSIEEALRLDRTTVETVGEDFLVRGFVVETITTED